MQKNYQKSNFRKTLTNGIYAGIPIGLGYFAVSFSLGIAAKNAGLTPFQAFLASLLCNASAGEYAGFTTIAAIGTYFEMAIVTLITNARYLLMSCSLSQKLSPDTSIGHRLLIGQYVTDELFGIAISRLGYVNPFYIYGAVIVAAPCWALGTLLGTIAGNLLPIQVVSALSVALYGMFLAVIIPPARKNKVISVMVTISFILSYLFSIIPYFSSLSGGTRTIILTIVIASAFAILFPVNNKEARDE